MSTSVRHLFAVAMMVSTASIADAQAPSESIVMIELRDPLNVAPVRLSEVGISEHRKHVNDLAVSSGLALLASESSNEVRIWGSVATFDPGTVGYETVGYVIASSQARQCQIKYSRDGQPLSHQQCAPLGKGSHQLEMAALVEALLPYADSGMGCGIADGEWYDLDIVHDGKRFLISASNPADCHDAGSAAVASLIQAVHRLRQPPSK